MTVYGYCRCGDRVERNEYREHVLMCPAHEEDTYATDTLDEGPGTGRTGPVEPAEVDQVRADIMSRPYNTRYRCPHCGGSNTYGGDPYPCTHCGYDGTSAPRIGRLGTPVTPRIECERSAGDGTTCADTPDADLMGWCDTCREVLIGTLEAQVSTLASLVAFAYLVDVEFDPDWMDTARDILGAVGWEVDPQDWRNWDWSNEGATA